MKNLKPPEPASPQGDASLSRRSRGKITRRAQLIQAARHLMSAKGVEATSIQEITDRADVGFGTFYNYFKSKEELAGVVMRETMEEFAGISDLIFSREQDPAIGLCMIQKAFLDRATSDPVWGWFVVRSHEISDAMSQSLPGIAGRHLQAASQAGRFKIKNVTAAERITRGALQTQMRSLLEGDADEASTDSIIELLLRVYGLPHDEAARLSKTKLPQRVKSLYREQHA